MSRFRRYVPRFLFQRNHKTFLMACLTLLLFSSTARADHEYAGPYTGENLNRVAFPIGGIGTGMYCLEGTGAISHMSVRHRMEFFQGTNEASRSWTSRANGEHGDA